MSLYDFIKLGCIKLVYSDRNKISVRDYLQSCVKELLGLTRRVLCAVWEGSTRVYVCQNLTDGTFKVPFIVYELLLIKIDSDFWLEEIKSL